MEERIRKNEKILLVVEEDLMNQKHELATKRKAYTDTLKIANKKLKSPVDKNNMSAARNAQTNRKGF